MKMRSLIQNQISLPGMGFLATLCSFYAAATSFGFGISKDSSVPSVVDADDQS